MITSQVIPVDEPRRFDPHELFFSLTDDKGRIRYGNRVFTRVSAYREDELLGKPHNLIRHPDMPRCVFRLLWDYLEAGKTIAAYVKNLAADGRYYWVLAVVTPCRDGYLSVRLNPSSPLFDAAQELYAEVLAYESDVESDRGKQAAIEQSLTRLTEGLQRVGFESYDNFMRAALQAELVSRDAIIDRPARVEAVNASYPGTPLTELLKGLANVRHRLDGVFSSLGVFETLSHDLASKNVAMQELGPCLSVLALNANISATRLGSEGAVLSTVSRTLGECSKEADQLIGRLLNKMAPCCDMARSVCFEIAVAQLEAEVCESFVIEMTEPGSDEREDLIAESLAALTGELSVRIQTMLRSLQALWSDTLLMKGAAQELARCVSHMRVAQLSGKIDIASRPNDTNFGAIFDDMASIVDDAKQDCDEIADLLNATAERLGPLLKIEPALRSDLCGVDLATTEIASANAMALENCSST